MKSATPYILTNSILFALVLITNYLANALPIAGRTPAQVSNMFPTQFTPAGFTFAIWGVIYLLLIGFTIYQWLYFGQKVPIFMQKIGWLFVLSCVANVSWLLAFHHLQIGLSMIIMFVLLSSLISIYLRLETEGRAQRWLVRMPFSVYLGWISVATIANAGILFTYLGWNGQPGGPQIWTVMVVMVAVMLAMIFLLKQNDFAYPAVIVWALYGIYKERIHDLVTSDALVETVALAGLVLVMSGIAYQIFKNYRISRDKTER